jgi:hypothetical protein
MVSITKEWGALKQAYTNYDFQQRAQTGTMLVDKTLKALACGGTLLLAVSNFYQHTGMAFTAGQYLKPLSNIRAVCWTGRLLLSDIWTLPQDFVKKMKWSKGNKENLPTPTDEESPPKRMEALATATFLLFQIFYAGSECMKLANNYANIQKLGQWAAIIGKGADYALVGVLSSSIIAHGIKRYNHVSVGEKSKLKSLMDTKLPLKLEKERIKNQIDALDNLECTGELINYSISEGITQFPGMEGVSIVLGFATVGLNVAGIFKSAEKATIKQQLKSK